MDKMFILLLSACSLYVRSSRRNAAVLIFGVFFSTIVQLLRQCHSIVNVNASFWILFVNVWILNLRLWF